jgi:probable rRNA maturation factor
VPNRKRTETQIRISVDSSAYKRHVVQLKSKLRAAHAILPSSLRELSIVLVGDRRMTQLHKQFMGISGPTDVLTFPLDLDRRGKPISGEVFVCVPEALRRCRELGTNLQNELLLYALHGMLHLSGFDDRTARHYRRMHRKEDAILRRLGVGAVFLVKPMRKRSTTKGTRR